MKNIIIGICSCVLIGILILTVYTLQGRSIRKAELDAALTASMKNVMEELQTPESCGINSNQELTAVFLQNFLMQIDSNSKVSVHILDADYEKGLLSVEAVSEYTHPVGLKGAVSTRQTVILEKYSIGESPEYCCIDYMVEGTRYKTYSIQKGENLIVPAEPVCQGENFVGWRRLEGTEVVSLNGQTVASDSTFVAVFE